MNEQEMNQWIVDARAALSARYNPEEVKRILYFMVNLRGYEEYEIMGKARLDAYQIFSKPEGQNWHKKWSLYNVMMCKMWIYAPEILALPEMY